MAVTKIDSKLDMLAGSLDDLWKGMTERDGAQTHAVFDELIAVQIPDVAAKAPGDEARRDDRVLVITLRISVRTARNGSLCPAAQRAPSTAS